MAAPIKVFNQSFSCLAPLVMNCDLDFTQGETYTLDLTDYLSQGYIDFVSSVYVNLRSANYDLILTSMDIQQEVFCKRGTISYMPIMLSNWPRIRCEVSSNINSIQRIVVSNIPFFPFIQEP